jgi:hypothetical protein
LKAKTDIIREELWFHQGQGYLVTSEEECTPPGDISPFEEGALKDARVISCGGSGQFCIEDTASSLGGVCATVVSGEVEAGKVDNAQATTAAATAATKKLKPLTVMDKLAAKGPLEGKEVLEYETDLTVVGEECDPGTNPGYVDVGIFNQCHHSDHVCIEDSSSSLGGHCVGIVPGKEDSLWLEFDPQDAGGQHRRLTECTYLNGTAGIKCSGHNACVGLSPSFVENNIGCRSCNSFGACSGISGESDHAHLYILLFYINIITT